MQVLSVYPYKLIPRKMRLKFNRHSYQLAISLDSFNDAILNPDPYKGIMNIHFNVRNNQK